MKYIDVKQRKTSILGIDEAILKDTTPPEIINTRNTTAAISMASIFKERFLLSSFINKESATEHTRKTSDMVLINGIKKNIPTAPDSGECIIITNMMATNRAATNFEG
jgi:phosphosulfolactate phosphohydrolase-like enzyme